MIVIYAKKNLNHQILFYLKQKTTQRGSLLTLCSGDRIRTCDQLINSQLLYR